MLKEIGRGYSLTSEIRRDYLLDRWVIIAAERAKRPVDFVVPKKKTRVSTCAFCPGNERMTPPATLVYLRGKSGKIVRARDTDSKRPKNWLVRSIPNLYPALKPLGKLPSKTSMGGYKVRPGIGHHEVLIESPDHDEHPSVARLKQLGLAIGACIDRLNVLSRKRYVRYVSLFKNYRPEAGASISHAHSQIMATPILPKLIGEELRASRKFQERERGCVFCKVVANEIKGPRVIYQNTSFAAIAPWASVYNFEFWILPKRHSPSIRYAKPSEIDELAIAMRSCLGGLSRLLQDPPYNLGFHLAPSSMRVGHYHWHIEVYPKLGSMGGFELSTGMYINTMPPERAAEALREAVSQERICL
jgi:UDPglucose--hexose-1-phosphate uridylyltransferase